MSGINETGVCAYVPVKTKVGDKVVTYTAGAEIYAVEDINKECDITVYDAKIDDKKGSKSYSEDLTKKDGEEYLKALLWTEKCSNGIHVMYYTPK